MAKNDTEQFTVGKIEVDSKTAEPKIIEITENAYSNELSVNQIDIEPEDAEVADLTENYSKQVLINKVFGLNEYDSISVRQRIFKRVLSIVFFIFVIGVLAYTFYNDFFNSGHKLADWEIIKETLSENWFYVLLAAFSLFLMLFFKGSKLSVLCKVTSKKSHFKICLETGIIGAYYDNVTPLGAGGQPFEIYHLSKHGVHGGVASSIPIVAFFLNQLAFVMLAACSIIFLERNTLSFTATLDVLILSLAIIGLLLSMFVPTLVIIFSLMPRFCSRLIKFIIVIGAKIKIVKDKDKTIFKLMKNIMHNSKCIKLISKNPIAFFICLVLSLCQQLANASIAYFTLRFFGFDIVEVGGFPEWQMVVQLCFILYSAISFIPTPGNSGAADLSFYSLFSSGLVAGFAFSALMVWRFLSFYAVIIIGFIFINSKKRKEEKMKKRNSPPPEENLPLLQ